MLRRDSDPVTIESGEIRSKLVRTCTIEGLLQLPNVQDLIYYPGT